MTNEIRNEKKFNTLEGCREYAASKGWSVPYSYKLNWNKVELNYSISGSDKILDAMRCIANRDRVYRLSDYVRKLENVVGFVTEERVVKCIAKKLGLLVVDRKVFGRAVVAA